MEFEREPPKGRKGQIERGREEEPAIENPDEKK